MKRLSGIAVAFVALSTGLALPAQAQAQAVSGRWEGELPFSGVIDLETYALELSVEGAAVTGSFHLMGQELPLSGTFDPATGALALTLSDYEDSGEFDLVLREQEVAGTFTHTRIGSAKILATRPGELPPAERLVVDFSKERPEAAAHSALPAELARAIRDAVVSSMESSNAVGLSAAIVLAGELLELGGFGWEDYHDGVPATGATRYRWASISKPVTAMAALQLVEAGRLDLDEGWSRPDGSTWTRTCATTSGSFPRSASCSPPASSSAIRAGSSTTATCGCAR